jgi:sec-independent protein translocase protein TatB
MIGRAQRYVSDVKAEVNRSMDLDELKKMKETVEGAARDVENSIQTSATDFEKSWEQVTNEAGNTSYESYPTYSRPHKKWRMKTSATPKWFKSRAGVRTSAQSGAARVARYRPAKPL